MAADIASIVRGESYSASLSSAALSSRFMLNVRPTFSEARLPRGVLDLKSSPARAAADLRVVSTVAVYEKPWQALAAKSAPVGSNDGSPVLDRNHTCPFGGTR